jgi:catechol 2,3-dioxygenase-like lactoylglutathione lyase family enzyme
MQKLITGIHHVTAIAGNAQNNIDFYTGILGLRLVKKTVNFDAPEVYHFYYVTKTVIRVAFLPSFLITDLLMADMVRAC